MASPKTAPHPEAAKAAIDYLTTPEVQARVLKELGFFPVVSGVDTSNLPAGIAIEAKAVGAQSSAPDALPALLPVGLGARGGEINQIYRNAFDRVVLNGEQIANVLPQEAANLQKLMDETGAPCWAPDDPSDWPVPGQGPGLSAHRRAREGDFLLDPVRAGRGAGEVPRHPQRRRLRLHRLAKKARCWTW